MIKLTHEIPYKINYKNLRIVWPSSLPFYQSNQNASLLLKIRFHITKADLFDKGKISLKPNYSVIRENRLEFGGGYRTIPTGRTNMQSQQIQRNISLLQDNSLKAWTNIGNKVQSHLKQHSQHFLNRANIPPSTRSQILPLLVIVLCSVCNLSSALSAVSEDQQPTSTTHKTDFLIEDNFCADVKEKYKNAITNTESDERIRITSQTILIEAEAKFQQGQVKDAIDSLSKAHRLLSLGPKPQPENEGDSEIIQTLKALIHGRLGTACMSLEYFEHAKGEMREAIKIAEQLNNVSMLGRFNNDLGNILATEAMNLKEKIANLQEQTVDVQTEKEDSDIATMQKAAERLFDDSISSYTAALIIIQHDSPNTPLIVMTHLNLAKTYLLNAQHSKAYENMTYAYHENKTLNDSTFKANAFISIGAINSTLLNLELFPDSRETFVQNAEYAFQEAIRIAKTIPDKRSHSHALGQWGHLLKETGQLDKSLHFTEKAGLLAQKIKAPDLSFKWEWQEGQLNKALGDLEKAEASYNRAKNSLQKLPRFTPVGLKGKKVSFREGRGKFFMELTDIYFQRALKDTQHGEEQKNGADSRLTNLVKARSTMEEFKKAEIQDFYQDDCVEAYGQSMKLIDEILSNSPPQMDPPIQAAVLYPIVLPDRLELLLSLPHEKLQRLQNSGGKVSETRLQEEVIRFREGLQTRGEHTYQEPGTQLFKWLISPALTKLKRANVNTLIIVPDGPLRTIPLGALYNQDKERFLLQDFAIAIASGIRLPDPKPMQRDGLNILSVGLPSQLPYVEQELSSLKNIFSGSIETLKDKEFTIKNVSKKMKGEPFTIVHIATHGKFEETIHQSYLTTGDDKPVNMRQLREMVGLFKFREAPLDLLTLSACETAVGSDQAALGLAGVALNAGAKSVVATLWPVDDQASAEFISDFYRLLQDNPNIPLAEALKKAQNQMVNHDFDEYRHPYYWAPFVLFNNWL